MTTSFFPRTTPSSVLEMSAKTKCTITANPSSDDTAPTADEAWIPIPSASTPEEESSPPSYAQESPPSASPSSLQQLPSSSEPENGCSIDLESGNRSGEPDTPNRLPHHLDPSQDLLVRIFVGCLLLVVAVIVLVFVSAWGISAFVDAPKVAKSTKFVLGYNEGYAKAIQRVKEAVPNVTRS